MCYLDFIVLILISVLLLYGVFVFLCVACPCLKKRPTEEMSDFIPLLKIQFGDF